MIFIFTSSDTGIHNIGEIYVSKDIHNKLRHLKLPAYTNKLKEWLRLRGWGDFSGT